MSHMSVAISKSAHQILERLAEQTGHTTTVVLDKALDVYHRKVVVAQVNAGYGSLRADPAAWADVERERRSMDGCLMDGLDPNECWGEDGAPLPPEGQRDG